MHPETGDLSRPTLRPVTKKVKKYETGLADYDLAKHRLPRKDPHAELLESICTIDVEAAVH